ncbi:Sialin [Aphelenchoides fujianensis]|nr:Sialin [Aphelenchoides fujianensis]
MSPRFRMIPIGVAAAEAAPPINPSASMKRIVDCDGGSSAQSYASSDTGDLKFKSRIFPSTRFFMALLLCLCFISLAISTSNISVSLVCMVRKPLEQDAKAPNRTQQQQQEYQQLMSEVARRLRRGIRNETADSDAFRQTLFDSEEHDKENKTTQSHMSKCALARFRKRAVELSRKFGEENDDAELYRLSTVTTERCDAEHFDWTSTQTGFILAAQNAGGLLMLLTGTQADRLNSKWTIVVSMSLVILSNVAVPLVSHISVWLTVAARLLTGFADALLQPSTSAMITRWFPPKERPFAIGVVTGGRQIGTLLIMPLAGFLCSRRELLGGWPSIFYFSALIGSMILIAWLLMAADKPAKQPCISDCERHYIENKIAEENLGKRKQRKQIPWRHMRASVPLYAAVGALLCHEWPLVIMLQLLPKYLDQIMHLGTVQNGFVSALPIGVLFISKTMSSSLSSMIGSRKSGVFVIGRTPLVKIFNAIASLGLAGCTAIIPLFNHEDQLGLAITALCMSMAFAGLHTPGVQTALLQLAPAYTGIVTGIAFGVVAIFGIINKIFSTFIVTDGTLREWRIVFGTSAVIAVLPVFFFTIWGSADRQPWATIHSQSSSAATIETIVKDKEAKLGGEGKIAVISVNPDATYAKPVSDDDEVEQQDDEAVVSALRLRMFLNDDEEDGSDTTSSDGSTAAGDLENQKQRF